MAKENTNMRIYNEVRNVPKVALKNFNNGRFSGTDINPMWRIEKLTEVFGICGEGWYFTKPEYSVEVDGQTKTVHCTTGLVIKKSDGTWSEPIWGTGGNTITSVNKDGKVNVSDEGYKMAYTDAQSNACKLIGLGADVWFEKSETKYTAKQSEPATESVDLSEIAKKIDNCKTADEVATIWKSNVDLQSNADFKAKIVAKGNELKKAS